jgi:hypothetical protein
VQTTAYHPQSNGLVERFHRRLKEALQARAAGPDWLQHLPWVLLGIRSAIPLEGGLSPAEAVMGCQPILPGEFLTTGEPPLEEFLEKMRTDALHPPPAGATQEHRPADRAAAGPRRSRFCIRQAGQRGAAAHAPVHRPV